MRYSYIERCSLVNGTGARTVLWTQGCSHNCLGCQNPDTHNPCGGMEWTLEAKEKLFCFLGEKWISGITFSGGDPLHKDNIDEVGNLVREIKDKYPQKTIWLYTGYRFTEVLEMKLEWLPLVDVLCEGRFVLSQRSVKKHWVGSSNQNVVNVKDSLAKGKMVLFDE